MNWTRTSPNCLTSDQGYLVSKYAMEKTTAYIARSKAGILYAGPDVEKAKAACERDLMGVAA
jgi:hypothetical protein